MYKITSNYHTHTSRCGHATGEDEQYVQCAIEAGIKVLGFSDHTPWPGLLQPKIRMSEDLLENYVKSLTFLKEKYKDQIEIHIGLEVEYIDEFVPFYEWMKKEKTFHLKVTRPKGVPCTVTLPDGTVRSQSSVSAEYECLLPPKSC